MYCTIEDFLADWKNEASATIKIFEAITEDAKGAKAAEHVRSLERLGWHITQTLTEMPARAGIVDEDVLDNRPIPSSFKEIINEYQTYSEILANQVKDRWSDEMLIEEVEVYGQKWQRKKILSVLVLHQVHHRGQMTALMRVQGLKVPGIYGTANEE